MPPFFPHCQPQQLLSLSRTFPASAAAAGFLALLLWCCTAGAAERSVTGYLTVLWGDGPPGKPSPANRYFLFPQDARPIELLPGDGMTTAVLHLHNGKVATVAGHVDPTRRARPAALVVERIRVEQVSAAARAMVGAQPWITLMCRFSDVSNPAEEPPPSYFTNMYSATYPGLGHYWREASYGAVSLDGSLASGWHTLPHPRGHYLDGGRLDFDAITKDCLKTADEQVFFPQYAGINLMFNDELDGYAWGGAYFVAIDGRSQRYRMTWLPPWGYRNLTVVAHEMGHGFGMPHSSGGYGETYDNVWDVMSNCWAGCGSSDHPVYGCLGQHTIGYHRLLAGWLAEQRIYTHAGGTTTLSLRRITLPDGDGYLLAKVPSDNSADRYYTVEVRQRVGYDGKLPAEAVIIHAVDRHRGNGRSARLLDSDDNGYTGDDGAIWGVGETFIDRENTICIGVTARNTTGYTLKIGCDEPSSAPDRSAPWLPAATHLLLKIEERLGGAP